MRAIYREWALIATAGFVLVVAFLWFPRSMPLEDPYIGAGATVDNGTSVPLTIEAYGDGEWIEIATIAANRAEGITGGWHTEHSRTGREACATGPLRALDSMGEEVAFRAEPLCHGDTWVIEAAGY